MEIVSSAAALQSLTVAEWNAAQFRRCDRNPRVIGGIASVQRLSFAQPSN